MQIVELSNGQLRVELIQYGARIKAIHVRKKAQGDLTPQWVNVVQGYANMADYLTDEAAMGATMGPITNRISNASLTLQDKIFTLPNNAGAHCLHSGGVGFDRQYWSISEQSKEHVLFELGFDLSDIGLQGQLRCWARYTLSEATLTVHYTVHTDALTYLNMSNHVYLNLSGRNQRISDHQFVLFAQQLVELNAQQTPTGELVPVPNPLKYRLGDRLGVSALSAEYAAHFEQVHAGAAPLEAVDHHFVVKDETTLESGKPNEVVKLVTAHSDTSGLDVTIYSSAPGFQFYTANHLTGEFEPQSAFCIEPQSIPDAINQPRFAFKTVSAGESYQRVIAWEFA